MSKNQHNLIKHLDEQICLLTTSCYSFDRGRFVEGKKLSVIIRTLLHDTKNSISLLKHLGVKNKISYYSSNYPYDPKNLLTHLGLLSLNFKFGRSYFFNKFSYLDASKKIPFPKWWSEIVFVDSNKNKFSRKDIVLYVANKYGGAHIDKNIDKMFLDFSSGYSLGWRTDNKNGKDKPLDNPPDLLSVRQIAFELILSLEDEYPNLFGSEKLNLNLRSELLQFLSRVEKRNNLKFIFRDILWHDRKEKRSINGCTLDNKKLNVIWISSDSIQIDYFLSAALLMYELRKQGFPILLLHPNYKNDIDLIKLVNNFSDIIHVIKVHEVINKENLPTKTDDFLFKDKLNRYLSSIKSIKEKDSNFINLCLFYLKIHFLLYLSEDFKSHLEKRICDFCPSVKSHAEIIIKIVNEIGVSDPISMTNSMIRIRDFLFPEKLSVVFNNRLF